MCKIFEEIRQEGIEQGIEQGIERGIEKGKAEEREIAMRRESAIKKAFRMLLDGKHTPEEIAAYTDLSLEEIKEFAAIAAG